MNHTESVIQYYNATRLDYENLWTGKDDLAVHFGYYESPESGHKEAVLKMNQVLAESIHIKKSDKVLDAGCGYGGSSMWLSEKIGCQVTGITIVPFQVAIGNQKISHKNLQDRTHIINSDFSSTPFPSENFTVYWALESIVHAPDRKKVLNEAFRLLKPGGRLVIAEYVYRENPPLSAEEKDYMKIWLNSWSMPKLLTSSEYKSELIKAGFIKIKEQKITKQVKPSLKRLKLLCSVMLPGALFLRSLRLFNTTRLANIKGSLRQIDALDKGFWDYTIFTAEKN